jgi:hypothetical protein
MADARKLLIAWRKVDASGLPVLVTYHGLVV